MCGISGYFGKKALEQHTLKRTLELMKYRGPDFQAFRSYNCKNYFLHFLHSRLSIIDLEKRSNQPFENNNKVIIFNGEIYNYLEIKKKLLTKGFKFKTNSDTEVLLKAYEFYGTNCVNYFEGMWSFAIFDKLKNIIFISRDRFGEKPLFYTNKNQNFYFGSEVKFIKSLIQKNLNINYDLVNDFLNYGYKSLKKKKEFFYKSIKELEPGNNLIINSDGAITKHVYWRPNFKENKELNEEEIVEKSKNLLIESIKLTTRSDVPIAFTLSGGIDSASLVSIAAKKLNLNFKTYSIIDDDKRYDERKNINNILNDVQCDNRQVKIKSENSFENLIELIRYHEKPLASIAQLNHFNLMKEIKKDNIKVCLNGTMADELYAGYLDHHLQYFSSIKDKEYKKREIKFWREKVLKTIRNPIFRKHDLYIKNPEIRSHIFDNHELLKSYLVKKNSFKFKEKKFTNNLLRNRMLNEIFYENTPQILHDEDLNSMFNSIENRSPFINKKLFNFLFTVNTKFLIKNGFKKYILRKSMDEIVDNKVIWNHTKMGFNSSVESIYNFKDKTIKEFLFDKKSDIYEFIDYKKFQKLFLNKKFPNHLSKFIFNVIGCKIFLENVDRY
tara:strand:- start:692 stop:2524 length:1833 start_codon:yes stop_codon:yes gene_type:complete